MATTASLLTRFPQIVSVGTTQLDVTLHPSRLYTVYHTGKSSTGGASTVDVFSLCDNTTGAVSTSYSSTGTAGVGKLVIQSGNSVPIPNGCSKAQFKTASGTVSLQFVATPSINFNCT